MTYGPIQFVPRTEYRLTVHAIGEQQPTHTFSYRLMPLVEQARRLPESATWTIYKRGPLFLPERPIRSSND